MRVTIKFNFSFNNTVKIFEILAKIKLATCIACRPGQKSQKSLSNRLGSPTGGAFNTFKINFILCIYRHQMCKLFLFKIINLMQQLYCS